MTNLKLINTSSKLELFKYQIEGASWLASKRHALLADKQRLGKTVQAIRATDLVHARHPADQSNGHDEAQSRVLVICRAVARENWKREFERWQTRPRHVKVFASSKVCPNPPPSSVTITNYEQLSKVMEGLNGKFDIIICDEAHALKEPSAKRTQRVLGKNGFAHRANRFWSLTGTPTPSHAGELWTHLYTFGLTKLGYWDFVNRFCETFDTSYETMIKGTKTDDASIAELRGLLSGYMLRRTENEVGIELPAVFTSEILVEAGEVDFHDLWSDEILRKYDVDRLKEIIAAELGVFNAIVNQTASDQLLEVLKMNSKSISTLRRYTALQKVQPLVDLITEELDGGAFEKVVVFGIHTAALNRLKIALGRFHPVIVNGATKNPSEEIAKFQDKNSEHRVFLGNISAAGTSITLDCAHHIYFLEEDWVPGANAQAAMRCGGPNQKQTIFVRRILLKNSVDMKVSQTVDRKTKEQLLIYQNIGDIL